MKQLIKLLDQKPASKIDYNKEHGLSDHRMWLDIQLNVGLNPVNELHIIEFEIPIHLLRRQMISYR